MVIAVSGLTMSRDSRFEQLPSREVEQMEHWGIYVAYAWLATIMWAFIDAVQAVRKGRQPQPSAASSEPRDHN